MLDFFLMIAMLSGVVPFAVYLPNSRHLNSIRYIYFTIIVFAVGAVYEIVGTHGFKLETQLFFRLYSIMEPAAFLWFFFKLFNGKHRVLIAVFFFLLIVMGIWTSLDYEHNKGLTVDSYFSMFACVMAFTLSVLWFKDMFSNISEASILNVPAFYFISGIVLYLAGTLFCNILGDLVVANLRKEFIHYWLIIAVMGFIMRTLFTIGICRALPK